MRAMFDVQGANTYPSLLGMVAPSVWIRRQSHATSQAA